jgi:UDP-glucose 4-epimerase
VKITGIRPGEKIHEILVSEEEAHRTIARGAYYAIQPILPELRREAGQAVLTKEYSSADDVMDRKQVAELLKKHKLRVEDHSKYEEEMLR